MNKTHISKKINPKHYATIKRGKVKVGLNSRQFKFLMSKKLPLSIVTIKNGKKNTKRVNT